jgi:hypothetical protein
MEPTRRALQRLGLPTRDAHELPTSNKRFPDGAQYRLEIPSTEGPRAFELVLDAAHEFGIAGQIQRISQGSGIMLLADGEIRQMAAIGRREGIEVSLFVGPKAGWETSATARTPGGAVVAPRLRGADQLVYAIEDVRRAMALGIRGVLVADEGLLWVLDEMRRAGDLPADLVIKISVMMGSANPASLRLLERLGAGTLNVPTDLTLAQLAAVRQATDLPLDVYVEAPDELGGFIRHYEIPELIRVAAPVYVKFGLRNAPNVYPAGTHLEATALALTRERVRRASLGLAMIQRYYPEAIASRCGAAGLAVPVE